MILSLAKIQPQLDDYSLLHNELESYYDTNPNITIFGINICAFGNKGINNPEMTFFCGNTKRVC